MFYYTEWLKKHPFTFKLRSADASPGRAETNEWMVFNVGLPKCRVQWSLGLEQDDPWVAVSLQLRDEARNDIDPLAAHRHEIERDLDVLNRDISCDCVKFRRQVWPGRSSGQGLPPIC